MPAFTIETTYRLPVYRQRNYEAESLAQACRLAIEDDDWEDGKHDYDSSGETYVTGAWEGSDNAHSGPWLQVPSHYDETLQRKADHFEVLLGLVKVLASAHDATSRAYWRDRAALAAAKAEAILAGARDPDVTTVTPRLHTLLCFDEAEVRTVVAEVIAGDDASTGLRPDNVTDADVRAACLTVTATADLSEERGSALFRAALAAIRRAERRLAGMEQEEGREKEE
jgi:hypothetical protein